MKSPSRLKMAYAQRPMSSTAMPGKRLLPSGNVIAGTPSDAFFGPIPTMKFSQKNDVSSIVGGTTATDAATFLGQNVNALERLASEFARAVVSALLESF